MMRYIHTIVLLLMMLLPLGSMAQSLEIVEEFKENKMSTVLTTYKNEFGHREKQHVMDNKFPFAVLEVYLEGDEQAVKAAKSKLSLDLGSHFTVEGVCKTYNNRIVFLISSSVRNVYMTCDDGCKEQVIFSGQTLEQNRIYSGKVKYTPAVAVPTPDPVLVKRQFYKFRVTPADALVEVVENGKKEIWNVVEGVANKALYYGSYAFSVSANRYYTQEGTITVSDTNNETTINLKPRFGWLTIPSNTIANGASVYATHNTTGVRLSLGTIPMTKKEMDAGEYTILILQEKYKDYFSTITVTDDNVTMLQPILAPNFARVTLRTDVGSSILIDEKELGADSWTGTLELGEYVVETRQRGHQSAYTTIMVTASSEGKTITLNNPDPIYGSLMISGTPSEATVYVDGKLVGNSPLIVNDILIGEHQVKVEKDGCAVWKKTVTVAEKEECIAQYELEKGVSLDRVVLNGLNATNLSVKRDSDEALLFTYDLPMKGPVRLRMSTDGYTYTDQKNVAGAIGREIDKGKGYQIAWTIPKDLGRTMQDSLYFQIVALPKFPEEKIKLGGLLYYQAVDDGTSVGVAKNNYEFIKINIPLTVKYKGHEYSVTSIGEGAFRWCNNLTSVTVPKSVTSIGNWAFSGCDNLTSISVDKDNPIYDSRDNCNAIIETATNTLIAGCKSTEIPNSVTSIGDWAFSSCENLTSVTIPKSVTSIGNWAFSSCDNLTSISVDKDNPIYDSRDNCNAIIETATNTLIAVCKSTEIPKNVTSIGNWAFSYCDKFTSITIPNSVTSIGEWAFSGCDNLTSVTIPNSVTSIGKEAFEWCNNLTSIKIPKSVTSIGEGAFSWCNNLTSIIVDKNNPIYDSRNNCNAIIETATNTLIAGCKNTVIPKSVTSIGASAFSDCKNLTSITIPKSVTSIGEDAFRWCNNLTSITIPKSVTSIGEEAFFSCDNLTSIKIPKSVTSIGEGAFSWCNNLTSLIVDKNNPIYDSRNNCNAIIETATNTLIAGCKNTVIPNSVTSIGKEAFKRCDNLTSIEIPNSVTSIGEDAFSWCNNLTSVTIPKSVTSIGNWAFSGCDKLKKIYIPRGTKAKFAAMEGLKEHVDKLVER